MLDLWCGSKYDFDNFTISVSEISKGPSATIPNVSITTECPPPRLQRQNTLIQSDPKNFQAILSKEIPEASVNSNVNMDNKETLKVPVADLFPEKLQEQNYSRRKKISSDNKRSEGEARKKSPVRKLSTCLEPHEPVIDSLPAPVPVSPAPRSEDWLVKIAIIMILFQTITQSKREHLLHKLFFWQLQ